MELAPIPSQSGPDRVTPKVFGTLNILFALGLMGCNLCYSYFGFFPLLITAVSSETEREAAELRAKAVRELEESKAEKPESRDKVEKPSATKSQPRLEPKAGVAPPPAAPKRSAWQEPPYLVHFAADVTTGLLANLLMLIAGVGLLRLKGWGRSMALGVAWFKIARLALLGLSMAVLVAPLVSRGTAELEAQAEAEPGQAPGPKPPPQASISRELGGFAAGWGIGLFVFGSIYPALTIWMLGRPDVRAAFDAPRAAPAGE